MRLCFDATRFGSGLQEAVELAAAKNLQACEFSFASFDVGEKSQADLDSAETAYLKSVAEICKNHDVEISCLRLNSVLHAKERKSLKEFKAMLDKLSKVASLLGCSKIVFYLEAGAESDWLLSVEKLLNPIVEKLKKSGLSLLLSSGTPEIYRAKSLRGWRPLEPQEWRDLLAGVPGLGLSFAVADSAWQGIEYLRMLAVLAPALEHVEAQDVQVNRQIISENGLFGPLWWRYMTVGKGQIDWAQFVEALKLHEYRGSLSIQFQDDFSSENELCLFEALDTSLKVLAPLVKY
ncbi:MAG: TIM barrel protein [Candidatus Obscuribacterales bacterium]|nr:TIM barrel protein [Candidatus Obscuribacterales bacterium]